MSILVCRRSSPTMKEKNGVSRFILLTPPWKEYVGMQRFVADLPIHHIGRWLDVVCMPMKRAALDDQDQREDT
jgi:hypothetical protein